MVVLPVALLGVAELVLRGAGYGHSTRPFIERHCHGGTVHVLNGHFFDQFFFAPIGGTYLWNSWSWVEVTQPKPPKTCRVFVFGGSAAQGFPYGFYCFRRMIETMLQASYPQTQFEVYCAAFPAVDSHVMRPMAKACAELDPDVFVVYLGNNEANGPFGLLQAADRGATVPHLAFIRTCIRTSDIRLVQLTGNLAAWVQRLRPPADKSGRSTLDGSVQAELLDRVYDHYAANLEAICKAGIDAGASVVLCTVGSNIRDWRPSSSIHTAGLNSAALDEWQRLYDEGRAREEAGMWSGAVEAYEEAEGIDGVHADLHFRLGCCYWNLELYDTAREHFLRAWESDLFVWIRATPRGNEIVVNSAASKDGVYLADCALALQGASPHGVPGKGLFCDDCHLTFEGNYVVACAIFEQVVQCLPRWVRRQTDAKPLPLSRAECARRLTATPGQLASHARAELDECRNRGVGHVEVLEQRIAEFEGQAGPDSQTERLEGYRDALEVAGPSYDVLTQYVEELLSKGHVDEGLKQALVLRENFPCRGLGHLLLARALAASGKVGEATSEYEQVLVLYPDDAETYVSLAGALDQLGRTKQAREAYRKALRPIDNIVEGCRRAMYVVPSDAETPRLLAGALMRKARCHEYLGEYGEALVAYSDAQAMDGTEAMALFGKGRILRNLGRVEEALRSYRETIELAPWFRQAYREADEVYVELGDADARVAAWRDMARGHPDEGLAHVHLGMALESAGDVQAALEAYRQALAINPDNSMIYAKIDGLHLERNDYSARVEEWRQATREYPDSVWANYFLGLALPASGDLDGAVEAFRRACALEPDNEVMQGSLRQAIIEAGKVEDGGVL